MSDLIPSQDGELLRDKRAIPGMRSDLDIMLLPFFPDEAGLESFTTEIEGYRITMRSEIEGGRIATSSDRKILNLLAAQIGHTIRMGNTPSRHVRIETRDMIDAIACDGVTGGSEYHRITERLHRLASTRIFAEKTLGENLTRERHFSWIDAFEQDVYHTPGGRKILALKISLSEDAFEWITRNEGFEMSREDFHALTASRSSSWRIYEICLAHLVRSDGRPVWISIDELRRRVPISSDLKVFKARTLKMAMAAVAENSQMARMLSLTLERKKDTGFRELVGKERVPLDQVHVCVRKGPAPLPEISQLIRDGVPDVVAGVGASSNVVHGAFASAKGAQALRSTRQGLAAPHDLPLFRNQEAKPM